MSKVREPPRGSGLPSPTRKPGAAQPRKAVPSAKASPRARFRRPVPVDTEAEEAAAFQRHHAALLEEEARHHVGAHLYADLEQSPKDIPDEKVADRDRDREKPKKKDPEKEAEQTFEKGQKAVAQGLAQADGSGRYFQDVPTERLGDLELTDPEEMQKILGPSVRFAQHAMFLAHNKMIEQGHSRPEALSYLASLYLSLRDRPYAQKALRDFGPATGILDLYPLELIDHLLNIAPEFLVNVSRGRFITHPEERPLLLQSDTDVIVRYAPQFRIRGFGIKGGAKPGYLLEPVSVTEGPQGIVEGELRLRIISPGTYQLLISGLDRDKRMVVEEMEVVVSPNENSVTPFAEDPSVARQTEGDEALAEHFAKQRPHLSFQIPKRRI